MDSRAPAIRRFLAMLALAGLAACAPPLADMPPLSCPVASTQEQFGQPEAMTESINRPTFWVKTAQNGSNVQLASLINAAESGFYGQVDRRLVQYGKAAQRFRLENSCPDIPNSTMF